MQKAVSIFGVSFFLATICTIVLADAVPGALLYFDARDNNRAHPDAWRNLGTVGGELSGAGKPPELEQGTIAIPALGIDTNSKFYTHNKADQAWGDQGDDLEFFIEDWTLEFLFKLHGENHQGARANQFAGFQPKKLQEHNAIRLFFGSGLGELGGIFSGQPVHSLRPGRNWTEDGWIWLTLTRSTDSNIKVYQDGKLVDLKVNVFFHKTPPIEVVSIGANSYVERGRSFTGSIALVRLYDIALDKNQVKQNITAWIEWRGVDPASKLTMTWGRVKAR